MLGVNVRSVAERRADRSWKKRSSSAAGKKYVVTAISKTMVPFFKKRAHRLRTS